MRTRGFTLIELLVVILIIAILAGLLFPALSMLRRQRAIVASKQLMNQVALAVDSYLEDYPRLGDDPTSFSQDPLLALVRRQLAAGHQPYLDLGPSQAATGPWPGGPFLASGAQDAEHVLDAYSMPLVFTLTNVGVGADAWTAVVEIRSRSGSLDEPDDDLVLRMTVDGDVDRDGTPDQGVVAGAWQWVED